MTVYTLFSQPGGLPAAINDNAAYTMCVQFSVSVTASLTAIWFYSPSGSVELPEQIALFDVSSHNLLWSETPTWSAAAGTGWVRAQFATPQTLTAGQSYKGGILKSGGSNFWYSSTSHYWDSGAGSAGITNGPLSAPNDAGTSGQDSFNAGTGLVYPNGGFNATNYWIDIEVTTSGGGTAISVSDFAGMVETPNITVTVPVVDIAAVVERLAGTMTVLVSDVAGARTDLFNPSVTGVNLALPAIVFVAGTYKGDS